MASYLMANKNNEIHRGKFRIEGTMKRYRQFNAMKMQKHYKVEDAKTLQGVFLVGFELDDRTDTLSDKGSEARINAVSSRLLLPPTSTTARSVQRTMSSTLDGQSRVTNKAYHINAAVLRYRRILSPQNTTNHHDSN